MKNTEITVAKNGAMYTGVDIAAGAQWCLPEILKFQICFYYRLEGTKVFLTVVAKAPWPFVDSRIELEFNSNVEFEISFFKIVDLKIGVKNWQVDNKNVCFDMYASVCVLNQCINKENHVCLRPPVKSAMLNEEDAFKALVMNLLMDSNSVKAETCNCH